MFSERLAKVAAVEELPYSVGAEPPDGPHPTQRTGERALPDLDPIEPAGAVNGGQRLLADSQEKRADQPLVFRVGEFPGSLGTTQATRTARLPFIWAGLRAHVVQRHHRDEIARGLPPPAIELGCRAGWPA